jgi:hypothetical protein
VRRAGVVTKRWRRWVTQCQIRVPLSSGRTVQWQPPTKYWAEYTVNVTCLSSKRDRDEDAASDEHSQCLITMWKVKVQLPV